MRPAITSPHLEVDGISHGFFTRQGGVSEGLYATANMGTGSNDDQVHILENRQRALDHLEDQAIGLNTLYQIHSSDVVVAEEPWDWDKAPRADAIITRKPGLAVGVLTADCTPILMMDRQAGVVAAAHAGWKGALKGIIGKTIEAMTDLGCSRKNIRASVGPAIAQKSYEVGPELRKIFLETQSSYAKFFIEGKADRFQLDLEAFIAEQLSRAGIQNIDRLGLDTYALEDDFYSYRRATHRHEPD